MSLIHFEAFILHLCSLVHQAKQICIFVFVNLDTPIDYLKGVGTERAQILKKEASIYSYGDLLEYYPFRYIDKTQKNFIADLSEDGTPLNIEVKIEKIEEIGQKRAKRLSVIVSDHTGTLELIWFKGIKWIKPKLVVGKNYSVYGKVSRYGRKWNIAHPDIEPLENQKASYSLQPVYHSSEKMGIKGLNSRGVERLTLHLISVIPKVPEILPEALRTNLQLIPRDTAFRKIHFPSNNRELKEAKARLTFDEFFFLQLEMLMNKQIQQKKLRGFIIDKLGDSFNEFYHEHLPFELTGAQKKVLKEIRRDLASGIQMNRLLQGDVGSGKTIVSLLSILMILDASFQGAIMAPTEILAQQHFEGFNELLEGTDIKISLLTGSVKSKEKKEIKAALESGDIDIVIGTHALLEDNVKFKNLGLVVIDEQHRFGVAQRAKLWKKNTTPPHILVMTATPIPRTLAMTLYGDLDVSVIDELPPGRKPIKTIHKTEKHRLSTFGFIKEQIEKGHQVYIVYPLIEESEKLDYQNLMDGYEAICRHFPLPEFKVSVVHGRMKAEDKDYEMQRFVKGETQIMVATTVIEVGVNVPNASVMVIENSEKFGLSQLHQLRGRVGRGADQSYCILMSSYKLTENARTRLETMVRTNDGFEISEVDLRLRGPGDIMGTRQSGILDLKIADIARDNQWLVLARKKALELLDDDPLLKKQENRQTAVHLMNKMQGKSRWAMIS